MAGLEKKKEEPKAKDPRDDLPEAVKQALSDWVAENPWFTKDPELNAVANAIHVKLLDEKPGLTIAQNLEMVRERVAEKYPEKFGLDDKPKRVSRVEGGSRTGGGGNSLYSKLPTEAKQIADKQIDLYLQPGETAEKDGLRAKERWAKVYWEQPGV